MDLSVAKLAEALIRLKLKGLVTEKGAGWMLANQ